MSGVVKLLGTKLKYHLLDWLKPAVSLQSQDVDSSASIISTFPLRHFVHIRAHQNSVDLNFADLAALSRELYPPSKTCLP